MVRAASQGLLFDTAASFPSGLVYRPEFITPAEEAALIAVIERLPFENAVTDGYTARRRFVHFGWGFDFEREVIVPGDPLPGFLLLFANRIAKWLALPKGHMVEALINEYTPGTPLGWHRDNEKFESIIGLSLGSWARIRFRPLGKPKVKDNVFSLTLEPRSAYIMQNDIRWRYQHSVAATPALRYSITFRTLPLEYR